MEQKQSNFLVTLLSILLIISCLIAGFFAYQTQKLVKEIQGIRSEEIAKQTPIPTAAPDPTADWKTYTSKKYGFTLKYPDSYEIIENNNTIVSFGFKMPADDKPFQYLKIYNSFHSTEPKNSLILQINGINAKKFDFHNGVDSDYKVVQISKPKLELEMYVSGGGLARDFEQILSTFKFIEPTTSPQP